ncbi:1,4-alpha-glucan branching protein GlgB [Desulfolutivibrio sp.]|uniref:1,4-alpha-glucan branching protein GlgB n=1 Tax=Desulfolutivibrio sp. TaxID=2773296 RepID=UPI002F96464A
MRRPHEPRYDTSLLTDHDIYLFKEGNHFDLHDKLGSHPMTVDGEPGTLFAVWAPNAAAVSVVGDFNGWDVESHPLAVRLDSSGIWEGFLPGIGRGALYKYHIVSATGEYRGDKGDPFARFWETSPKTASIVWDLDYAWGDGDWMAGRGAKNALDAPLSIYEVHLGSFAREMGDRYRSLSYLELADRLTEHVLACGFTHVEFLPVMEHPFFGSWGYQTLGYFAPTSRFGTPQEFMALIDRLHQAGIGVILDWVPSHFPTDGHGLSYFDGTHLFEHADPRRGYHPDWNCYIFNTGRYEVRAFLISSAMFWLSKYHIDGLRVDAVASMLYLDYSRKDGEWIPNIHGGRENLDNITFFQKLNEAAYTRFPDIQTMAEESTAWPMVSRPPYIGGLGFGMKWNMGWMHDTLRYFSRDPIHRKFHHGELTFGIWYAFTENYILPLSHDEVVYGKGSLLGKMPGDDWQKFANLRLLYALMYAHPGKKLLFMGAEIAQWSEWNHDAEIDWRLLEYRHHRGVMTWVRDLNDLYRREPALHERDFEPSGFEWVDFRDAEASVVAFLRKGARPQNMVLGVFNFTPVARPAYRVGVPMGGVWTELLNSDADVYGGSGLGNAGAVAAQDAPGHGHPYSLEMVLPPLSAVLLTPQNWL